MQPPDAILASSGVLSAIVGAVQDDPDAPDGSWLAADVPFSIRFSFPTPAGTLTGTQTVKAFLRKRTGAAPPNIVVSLYESGVLVRELTTVSLTSTTGQMITTTFAAGEVTSGANVEILVVGVPPAPGGVGTAAIGSTNQVG